MVENQLKGNRQSRLNLLPNPNKLAIDMRKNQYKPNSKSQFKLQNNNNLDMVENLKINKILQNQNKFNHQSIDMVGKLSLSMKSNPNHQKDRLINLLYKRKLSNNLQKVMEELQNRHKKQNLYKSLNNHLKSTDMAERQNLKNHLNQNKLNKLINPLNLRNPSKKRSHQCKNQV